MKGVTHNLSPESATPFHTFPRSQQVTYKFFEGRIAIFNELYVSLHWRSQDLRCMHPAYHESKKHCHLQRAVCMSTLEKSRPALHASSLSMNLKSIKVIRMQIFGQSGAIERQVQIFGQSGAIERQMQFPTSTKCCKDMRNLLAWVFTACIRRFHTYVQNLVCIHSKLVSSAGAALTVTT